MSESEIGSVDKAIDELARMAGKKRRSSVRRGASLIPWYQRLLGYVVGVLLAVVLPFVALIRLSISLYSEHNVNHWVSLGLGVMTATLILMLYAHLLARRIGMGRYLSVSRSRTLVIAVGAYCVYTLLYLGAANAKTEEVQRTYSDLHPLIRVAVATLVLVDPDAVVTDAGRQPEDYRRMGLPVNEGSLHFKQSDDYVHAVDIRTVGRTDLRNILVRQYFRLCGLYTLRHVGTADHLHVSLRIPTNR